MNLSDVKFLLNRAAFRLNNWLVPHAIILMYHRVIELSSDPQLLAVTPAHFEEHLDVIRRHYHPYRLGELVQALLRGDVPRKAVVITFDDAYTDNLQLAKPLLERYGIPATTYATTEFPDPPREFWWDELERLVLTPGCLPESVCLGGNGHIFRFDIGKDADFSLDMASRTRQWHVEQRENPTRRHALYLQLYQFLYDLSGPDRWYFLEDLRELAGVQPFARPTHRVLSPEDVARLGAGGLIEVGAHTVTHPVLSHLTAEEQAQEISQSKARLEQVCGRPINSFAYPHGAMTAETVAAVREAGFLNACSSDPTHISTSADLFRLPRLVVRDCDGNAFDHFLKVWLGY